jgi:hypothetical protein
MFTLVHPQFGSLDIEWHEHKGKWAIHYQYSQRAIHTFRYSRQLAVPAAEAWLSDRSRKRHLVKAGFRELRRNDPDNEGHRRRNPEARRSGWLPSSGTPKRRWSGPKLHRTRLPGQRREARQAQRPGGSTGSIQRPGGNGQ